MKYKIYHLLSLSQFKVVDISKSGEVTTVMMTSDRDAEATISYRKYGEIV